MGKTKGRSEEQLLVVCVSCKEPFTNNAMMGGSPRRGVVIESECIDALDSVSICSKDLSQKGGSVRESLRYACRKQEKE